MGAAQQFEVPKIIGHRGAAGHAPENTVAGFRKAAALGVRWVEFDVQQSLDGHVVLFHDETLERTTSGRGKVGSRTLSELQRLDAGAWFAPAFQGERIPSLSEALRALAALGLGANVEIKPAQGRAAETARAVARLLQKEWPDGLPAPLISSFSAEALAVARDAAPEFPRALLARGLPADWRDRLRDLGCTGFHCAHDRLKASEAAEVIKAGYALRCYTVNERKRADTLFRWGVDSVFSDYPDRLL